ncbi:MAG: retropepsin-like domain-containing protein, partial [Candidatus Eremiobacteraeota bacterium]|nr:retropepsin-like domain-containing protein [Candidatus Eremiobacteraeota bacterium]
MIMFAFALNGRTSAATPRQGLETLLAHVRSASGEPYTAHIVSEAQQSEDGGTVTVHVDAEGDRILIRRCRAGVCGGEYFDGMRSFAVNLNETALPSTLHPNDDERVLQAVISCSFASSEFRAAGGSVAAAPSVHRGSTTLRRVTVQSGDADLSVLIDPKSWMPVEVDTSDGHVVVQFGDFRKVGRFLLPFEARRGDTVLERYTTRRVATQAFAPPAGLVPHFLPGTPSLGLVAANKPLQPVVSCTVGGVAVNCLIDSGNSSLGMSLELAERLGLSVTGEYEVSGIGRYVTGIVNAPSLRVGPATFGAANYVVLHDVHDYGYDVVLGADFLAHTRTTIDYAARSVEILNPQTSSPPAIPLRFDGFLPVVDVQLGAIDVPLAIDTGDEATINLPYAFYQDHPGLFEVRGRRQVGG